MVHTKYSVKDTGEALIHILNSNPDSAIIILPTLSLQLLTSRRLGDTFLLGKVGKYLRKNSNYDEDWMVDYAGRGHILLARNPNILENIPRFTLITACNFLEMNEAVNTHNVLVIGMNDSNLYKVELKPYNFFNSFGITLATLNLLP